MYGSIRLCWVRHAVCSPWQTPTFRPCSVTVSLVQTWQVSKMIVVARFSVCECAAWKPKRQHYVCYSNLISFTHSISLSTVILHSFWTLEGASTLHPLDYGSKRTIDSPILGTDPPTVRCPIFFIENECSWMLSHSSCRRISSSASVVGQNCLSKTTEPRDRKV